MSDDKKNLGRRPVIEWVIAMCSMLLVAGLTGYFIYTIFADEKKPAEIKVGISEYIQTIEHTLVAVKIDNIGDLAASLVRVRGRFARNSGEISERELEIDYLGPSETRQAWFQFPGHVGRESIGLEVVGYVEP